MGWASGQDVLDTIADAVMPYIGSINKSLVAGKLIIIFENYDCDTIGDCSNKDIQKAYNKMYPEEK